MAPHTPRWMPSENVTYDPHRVWGVRGPSVSFGEKRKRNIALHIFNRISRCLGHSSPHTRVMPIARISDTTFNKEVYEPAEVSVSGFGVTFHGRETFRW